MLNQVSYRGPPNCSLVSLSLNGFISSEYWLKPLFSLNTTYWCLVIRSFNLNVLSIYYVKDTFPGTAYVFLSIHMFTYMLIHPNSYFQLSSFSWGWDLDSQTYIQFSTKTQKNSDTETELLFFLNSSFGSRFSHHSLLPKKVSNPLSSLGILSQSTYY